MLVMIYTTLVFTAWGIANRRTSDLLRLKQLQSDRIDGELAQVTETRDFGLEAASLGLALLETGDPPIQTDSSTGDTLPYGVYQVTFSSTSGDVIYVVKFTEDQMNAGSWTIDSIASDQWGEAPALSDMEVLPASF